LQINGDSCYYRSMSFYDDNALDDIYVASADRKRCIVCGSKKGDCTSPSYNGTNQHIIALGADEIIVEDDVWEEKEIAPGVTAKVLVVRAGKKLKKKKAEDLGII